SEAADIGLAFFAPRALEHGRLDRVGALLPRLRTVGVTELHGDLRQPIARSPAHDGRRAVHGASRAKFPDPGVRLVEQRICALAHPFELLEIIRGRGTKEPSVEKRLRAREHGVTVDVVLLVLVGLVAHAHGTYPAVPGQRLDAPLGELALEADAVHGLQV